MMQKRMNIDK